MLGSCPTLTVQRLLRLFFRVLRQPSLQYIVTELISDPDLYDKFIRNFQTPAEREAEGRSKGWGKTLESSLMRGEVRLEKIASSATGKSVSSPTSEVRSRNGLTSDIGLSAAELVDDNPGSKEEGRAAWDEFLRERFVRGGDEDFEYVNVDGDDDLDSLEYMDTEEAYFDDQEPEWADDSEEDEEAMESVAADGDKADGGRPRRARVLVGQTGIQDY